MEAVKPWQAIQQLWAVTKPCLRSQIRNHAIQAGRHLRLSTYRASTAEVSHQHIAQLCTHSLVHVSCWSVCARLRRGAVPTDSTRQTREETAGPLQTLNGALLGLIAHVKKCTGRDTHTATSWKIEPRPVVTFQHACLEHNV